MGFNVVQAKITANAVNENVKGFKVEYSAEHQKDSKPEFLRAVATKAGSKIRYEVSMWPDTGNVNINILTPDDKTPGTDVIGSIIKDLHAFNETFK